MSKDKHTNLENCSQAELDDKYRRGEITGVCYCSYSNPALLDLEEDYERLEPTGVPIEGIKFGE